MHMKQLVFSDETLRDGEQQVGIKFSIAQKYELAQRIASAGVHEIAIMPAVSKQEAGLAKKLLKSRHGEAMVASTMLRKDDIDQSLSLGFKKIILFSFVSPSLLALKKQSYHSFLAELTSLSRYAKEKGLSIRYAGVDATRTPLKNLRMVIEKIRPYIDVFLLCDTVGVLTPTSTTQIISTLVTQTSIPIGIHFHNDNNLVSINSRFAVRAGATYISGTIGGMGERAGNLDLVDFVDEMKRMKYKLPAIDKALLVKLRERIYALGGIPHKPYSQEAFWHESGIHVNAIMKNPTSFQPVNPLDLGLRMEVFYGRYSGISNYRYLFGDKYERSDLEKVRDHFKDRSYVENRSFTAVEVKEYVRKTFI